MASESCGVCGGDGKIGNTFGLTTTCPGCHGSGHRSADTGFRDVTKTKPAHHRGSNGLAVAAPKQTWPATTDGARLATEIRDSATCSSETKARLTYEIIEHESSHGLCTQTFLKKIRKQVGIKAPVPVRR
ncbi:MAG: molecular chaperone DnaJ [Polyangiaceae bacterium]